MTSALRLSAALSVLALAACSHSVAVLTVTSSAFTEGADIPVTYTCDGQNISPPLAIRDVPPEAVSLGLIMHDPDGEYGDAVHWIAWSIPKDSVSIAAGALPTAAVQGQNDAGIVGYSGPCRALKTAHRYVIDVYAFGDDPKLWAGADRQALVKAFAEHAIAKGTLTAMYRDGSDAKNTQPSL